MIIRFLKRLFGVGESEAPRVQEPEIPVKTIGESDSTPIAIVVGHNKKSQGAVNYLGESEYTFGKRIARKLQEKLARAGVRAAIIERSTGPYSSQCMGVAQDCKDLGAKFSLHLHFNSASSKAKGCEVLVAPTASTLDDSYADYVTDQLNKRFDFIERHEDGIKRVYKGHRGYKMLAAVRDAGTIPVLIEPCFANYRYRESVLIFESEDNYVDVLFNSLYLVARGVVPGVSND